MTEPRDELVSPYEARDIFKPFHKRRQRWSIIVAHRVSTVRDAQQIFVLDQGTIVERGTHEQLVVRDGPYASLYRKQLLEEELEAS